LAFTFIAIDFKEAVIFGFFVYILLILAQSIASKMTAKLKYSESLYADKRIKTLSEIINGINTIKAYAWEYPFRDTVRKWRNKQISCLVKHHLINSVSSGIFLNGGLLISLAVFGYHYFMGREFNSSRTLSSFAMMNYISLYSIFFCYSAVATFATF